MIPEKTIFQDKGHKLRYGSFLYKFFRSTVVIQQQFFNDIKSEKVMLHCFLSQAHTLRKYFTENGTENWNKSLFFEFLRCLKAVRIKLLLTVRYIRQN